MSWLFASGGQSIEALAISLSNEYSGFISFRIDWFDLLAVQVVEVVIFNLDNRIELT